MAETKTTSFWRFAESPFTWGGIGVFIGVAVASPTWFKYGFFGSIVSIGVGVLKAGFFDDRSFPVRTFRTLAICACLAGGGWELWRVIPKPTEPVTKLDIYDAVREALSSNAQSAPPQPAQPNVNKSNVTTKADLIQAVREALLQLNLDKAAGPPAARSASQYEKFSNDQLIAEAKVVAGQMSDYPGEWRYKVNEVGARYQNMREQSHPVPSPERINELWKEEPIERERVNQEYATNSKVLFARADDLRGVCADRLKKKGGQLPPDGKTEEVFKSLATTGLQGYGSNPDSDRASKYLLDLCKRLGP